MLPLVKPAIYSVATPIGNLDDISPRAVRVLQSVDIVAAEDTRHTRKLLSHLGIHGVSLVSYHGYSEEKKADELLARVEEEGLALALVTDAGTPCISDPGYRIIEKAHERGILVCPIPGPSALTALISASGLPATRVLFIGFLSHKAKEREAEMKSWENIGASIVFFEAMRRLPTTLEELQAIYPEAKIVVGRELSKLHEEIIHLPVEKALEWLKSKQDLRGEASIMVSLPKRSIELQGNLHLQDKEAIKAAAVLAFQRGTSLKDLLQRFRDCGLNRAELYDLLLEAKQRL